MKTEYILEGLDCANCAAKISDKIAKLDGFNEVNLNFATKTLTVKSELSENVVFDKVVKTVNSIEDGVTVKKESENETSSGNDKRKFLIDGITISAAAVMCALTLIPGINAIAKAVIIAAALIISGYDIIWAALKNIVKFNIEEKVLLVIAVTAAFIIGEYYEAVIVMILFKLGEMFEDISTNRSRREIEALADIRPDKADVIMPDGSVQTHNAENVGIGDIIAVKPYERIPLDGYIIEGTTTLDSSALTGESLPIEASENTEVMSGMLNCGGFIKVKVTKSYGQSAASRIIEMVKESAANKGRTDKFITRFAKVYTPIVVIAAALLCVVPSLIFGNFVSWLQKALVLLVASCPCALVISIPLGFFAASGAASKSGILIKGGKFVEKLAKARAVVFDKTGTLTTGKLSVGKVNTADGFLERDILRYAAVTDKYSSHPAAKAIINKYTHDYGDVPEGHEYMETPGHGAAAVIDGKKVLCGSAKWMLKNGCDISDLPPASVYVSADGRVIGSIEISDTVREESAQTIKELKDFGIRHTAMLSGDSDKACASVAKECALDEYSASLMPEQKVEKLTKIKADYGTTIFVGDGINDAPVLAAADAGAAMGLGSDAAIESADIVLVSDSPAQLPKALKICKRAMGVIKFNIVFALAVKALVFILVPFGLANMWMAVVADVGVSILSVLNATRILRFGK
ncbi:MAG TPA: cadmium-translocating P-type ATPase [Firmicutes bacterium]|nr:cadmium-translocating P-type ATPase [Bacillota bacterium]